jgi:uncharacterized protein (DUF1800 family)
MDSNAQHALIRFGLGRKQAEPLPADPRSWLRGQLEGPDPDLARPAPNLADMFAAQAQDKQAPQPAGQPSRVSLLWKAELGAIMANLVSTEMPFRERLVWFWANHFTVSRKRGDVTVALGPYLRDAIRPHVTGRFVDMLMAVMTHPAMLRYLDNVGSVGPDSPVGQRRHQGLNENLARECLELHTVTPAAGYTQKDVTAFAAALTGWSIELQRANPGFTFRDAAHEPGWQTVMGRSFPPGMQGGVEALTWLGQHPATYHNLASKLAVHFVDDRPPPATVRRIEDALHGSGGNLKAAALAVVDLPEAWQPPLGKLRTPFDFVTAVLRAIGFAPEQPLQTAQWMTLLGQEPLAAPLPNGWPDQAADWTGGESLLRRVDWSYAIAGKQPNLDPMQTAETALGPLGSAETLDQVRRAGSRREALTLLFAAPEFQRR